MPPERDLDPAALCERYETRLGMAMDYAEARRDVCTGSTADDRRNYGGRPLSGGDRTSKVENAIFAAQASANER